MTELKINKILEDELKICEEKNKKLEEEVKFLKEELNKKEEEEKKINLISSLIPICKNYDEVMNILNKIISPINFKYENLKKNNINDEDEEDNNNEDEYEDEEEEEEDNEYKIINNKKSNSTSPIVQIYHKNDLKKVVNVYDSIMEATREFNYNDKTASFTAIKKAYQHKTIYLDYRWNFILDRKETELFKPREIGETVITQDQNKGKIAMLNIDKTKIIKVFNLCKDAAKEILQHPSAMCVAVKFSTPLNNYYWMRWENIDDYIKNDFLESNILPEKYKNIRGIKIQQLDPITNETIKIFLSYTDVQKELKISIRKVKELIENNETYKRKI
jgi:hypothetical protein